MDVVHWTKSALLLLPVMTSTPHALTRSWYGLVFASVDTIRLAGANGHLAE